jgi:hypothetical protein
VSEQGHNAGDRRRVREQEKADKLTEQQHIDDLRVILSMPAGRRVLRHVLFDLCHLNESSYNPSGQLFAANEGRRTVAVELERELIEVDLEGWLTLQREHHVKSDV